MFHRDGNRSNNDPANLELRSGGHGRGATAYTEEVNRLLSLIPKQINAKVFTLSEYANSVRGVA